MTRTVKVTAPFIDGAKDPNDAREIQEFREQIESRVNEPKGFSLDQFALNGQAAEMEARMLDDVHILGRMAILGQSTVYYSSPNVGKTLLTFWLLIQAIRSGLVNGADVFYINADDNHKGLTFKLKLAEKHGFKMLAPGYSGFQADMLAHVLNQMIETGSANGKVLILDTVKKFVDIMRKSRASQFGESVRQFVAHGGSVVMLAHVNKHRGEDGKVIYSGTSDLVDDADCAYTLDVLSEDQDTRTVKFENFKSRGDVQHEAVYEYNYASGTPYQDRLDSVRSVTDTEREEAERLQALNKRYQANREAIQAIRETLEAGISRKTDLIKSAMDLSGLSRRRIAQALRDHTGTSALDYQYWTVSRSEHNAHEYRLNSSPKCGGWETGKLGN